LLRKMDRQSERLEKQKEKRESLREVREEEYWSVEKVTDGSAFEYEQQQLREEREQKSNGNRPGGGRSEQEGRGVGGDWYAKKAKNGIVIGASFCRSVRTLTAQSVRETYNPMVARSVPQGNQWVQASIRWVMHDVVVFFFCFCPYLGSL
jgi:hypothetical protein